MTNRWIPSGVRSIPIANENGPVCGIDYVDLHHQGRYLDDWDAYDYWRRDEDKVWVPRPATQDR